MKSHVNIMDSDIAYENVIVYHGSDHMYNERYLRTKKERMGHTLHFNK